jgi:hypothetical protein
MPEPTGNRWRDPDTGKIANPRNIQADTFKGTNRPNRYGPSVTGTGDEPEVAVTDQPRPQLEDPAPAPPPVTTLPSTIGEPSDYRELVDRITELGPRAQQGDAEAVSALNKIAEAEYGREDGGRLPIKRRLAARGISRPEKA